MARLGFIAMVHPTTRANRHAEYDVPLVEAAGHRSGRTAVPMRRRRPGTQARVAAKVLTNAQVVAVALPCLCEFVWVLRKVYGLGTEDIAAAIRVLLAAANVQVNRPAVEAGLSMLEANGDFADGVIAYEGNWLGGETFVSFDKQAVALLSAVGQAARLL